jgi:hypothetical protein
MITPRVACDQVQGDTWLRDPSVMMIALFVERGISS